MIARVETAVAEARVSPWQPMSCAVDVAHLGKLGEELNECASAAARCLIQGMNECEPDTGKPNRQWLREEIADVLANIELVQEHFGLNWAEIRKRADRKKANLRRWHSMIPGGASK